uniref:Uncharacterized protein n=1 Tax=Molossus molossus TaxID=27622 RepID=A0A7J8DPZ3_MOLMO|nr:hypothetical protein HJG59_009239 [Molossus molossus]
MYLGCSLPPALVGLCGWQPLHVSLSRRCSSLSLLLYLNKKMETCPRVRIKKKFFLKRLKTELATSKNSRLVCSKVEIYIYIFFFILTRGHFFSFFFFVQIRVGGRQRERERNIDVKGTHRSSGCHPHDPTRPVDKLQLRYMPLAGTEPGSLWTTG